MINFRFEKEEFLARFDVTTATKINGTIFWVVTPCTDVVAHQRFGGRCWLHLQGEVKIFSKFHRNVVVMY
jgi:hypothetical protein